MSRQPLAKTRVRLPVVTTQKKPKRRILKQTRRIRIQKRRRRQYRNQEAFMLSMFFVVCLVLFGLLLAFLSSNTSSKTNHSHTNMNHTTENSPKQVTNIVVQERIVYRDKPKPIVESVDDKSAQHTETTETHTSEKRSVVFEQRKKKTLGLYSVKPSDKPKNRITSQDDKKIRQQERIEKHEVVKKQVVVKEKANDPAPQNKPEVRQQQLNAEHKNKNDIKINVVTQNSQNNGYGGNASMLRYIVWRKLFYSRKRHSAGCRCQRVCLGYSLLPYDFNYYGLGLNPHVAPGQNVQIGDNNIAPVKQPEGQAPANK